MSYSAEGCVETLYGVSWQRPDLQLTAPSVSADKSAAALMLARHACIAAIKNREFCDPHHSVACLPLLSQKTRHLNNGE